MDEFNLTIAIGFPLAKWDEIPAAALNYIGRSGGLGLIQGA